MRSAVAPLVLIWIGLHALALMLLLAAKFLGAKLVMTVMLVLGTVWVFGGRQARLVYRRAA